MLHEKSHKECAENGLRPNYSSPSYVIYSYPVFLFLNCIAYSSKLSTVISIYFLPIIPAFNFCHFYHTE